MILKLRTTLVVGVLAQLFGSVAHAHIELLEPPSRYGRNTNKSCPCGAGSSDATCNVAVDGQDPNRSAQVSTFEAGSTIVVRFDEYIGHAGRFRVAFDPDGADFEDFNDHILLDVPDPMGGTGNIGEGGIWELEVTLPDTACDNCTLQLIQAMHGDQTNPVLDPANLSSYYTCADLVLVGGGDGSTSGGDDTSSTVTGTSGGDTLDLTAGEDTTATSSMGTTGASDSGGELGTSSTTTGTTSNAGEVTDSANSTESEHPHGPDADESSSGTSGGSGGSEEGDAASETSAGAQNESQSRCSVDAGGNGGAPPAWLMMLVGLGWLRVRRRTS